MYTKPAGCAAPRPPEGEIRARDGTFGKAGLRIPCKIITNNQKRMYLHNLSYKQTYRPLYYTYIYIYIYIYIHHRSALSPRSPLRRRRGFGRPAGEPRGGADREGRTRRGRRVRYSKKGEPRAPPARPPARLPACMHTCVHAHLLITYYLSTSHVWLGRGACEGRRVW